MRVTDSIIARTILHNLQKNTQSVYSLQQMLSTGRKFQTSEENPSGYAEALDLRREISQNQRYQSNLTLSGSRLNITESTLGTVNDRLQRARQLALQGANEGIPIESRESIADEIEQILNEVMEQANSNFEGKYIFSGDETLIRPFEKYISSSGLSGVVYRGDFDDRLVEIGQGDYLPINLTGISAFFSSLNEVTAADSYVPNALLAPQMATVAPPISVAAGNFMVNGVSVSFDPATDTLESLRDSINRTVSSADAQIDQNGALVIRSKTSNDVELANGTSNVLEALGMFHRVNGGGVGAGITNATLLTTLGITGDALQIKINADEVYDIDLAGAATVGDVLSAINASGAPVDAFINSAGTGLSISATESVDSLEISSMRKIFGATALAPGSVTYDTTLAALGITSPGILQINNNGSTTSLDLSAATTVGDVLDAINQQVNGITASLNANGTGLDIEAGIFGSVLTVSDSGASTIAAALGINQTRNGDSAGDFMLDVESTVKETAGENIFASLSELVAVLRDPESDAEGFSEVLTRFDRDLENIQSNRSLVGARANRVQSASDRLSTYETFLTELLSNNEDADLPEVITELANQTNVMNAALAAGAQIVQPSLMDFLR